MKKIISIICMLAYVISMFSNVAFAADSLGSYSGNDVIVSENFSSFNPAANSVFGSSSFKVVGNIANVAVENEALKLKGGVESKFFLHSDTALFGDFTIEFKFMQPKVGSFNHLFFLSDTSTANGMRIALDGGQIRVGDYSNLKPVKGYTNNNWYNVKIDYSIKSATEGTYSIYIDNEEVATDNSMYHHPGLVAGQSIQRMIMWSNSNNVDTYYDDFKVYREVKFDENSGITRLAYEDFSEISSIPQFTLLSNGDLKVVSSNNASIDDGRLKLDGTKGNNANIYADMVEGSSIYNKKKYVVEFEFTQDNVNNVSMLYAAGGLVGDNVVNAIQVTLTNGLFYYHAKNETKSFLTATKKGTPY